MKRCARCLTPVGPSPVPGYSYYCEYCDEDLYTIEVVD